MRKRTKVGLVALGIVAAIGVSSAQARADDDGYVAEVHYDVPGLPYTASFESALVGAGEAVCEGLDAAVDMGLSPRVSLGMVNNAALRGLTDAGVPEPTRTKLAASSIVSAVEYLCPRHTTLLDVALA